MTQEPADALVAKHAFITKTGPTAGFDLWSDFLFDVTPPPLFFSPRCQANVFLCDRRIAYLMHVKVLCIYSYFCTFSDRTMGICQGLFSLLPTLFPPTESVFFSDPKNAIIFSDQAKLIPCTCVSLM